MNVYFDISILDNWHFHGFVQPMYTFPMGSWTLYTVNIYFPFGHCQFTEVCTTNVCFLFPILEPHIHIHSLCSECSVQYQSNYKCHWTYSDKYRALYQYTHGFWTNISVLKLRIILVLSNSDSTFHQIQTLQLKKHQFGMDSCLNGLNLTKQNNWSNCVNYANQADDAKEMQCTLFILQIIMIESDWLLLHCEICTCVSQPLICIVWYFSSWKTEQTN